MRVLRWLLDRLRPSRRRNTTDAPRADSTPARRLRLHARAGDRARAADDLRLAVEAYGRAVEAALEGGALRRGESVCRRLLEVAPMSARARYLHVELAVRAGDPGRSAARLREYLSVARRTDRLTSAPADLLELAVLAPDAVMRGLIASALREAGEPEAADRVELGLTGGTLLATRWSRPGQTTDRRRETE